MLSNSSILTGRITPPRVFLAPDNAGSTSATAAKPAAAATAAVGKPPLPGTHPADLGDYLPGGELLAGATIVQPDFAPAKDFEAPEEDEPEGGEQTPAPADPLGTADAATAAAKAEADKKAAEEAAAAAENAVPGEWPESAKKRVDKLTAQRGEAQRERDELKAKATQLETQVAELKSKAEAQPAAAQAARAIPTAENPLAAVASAEQLDGVVADAEAKKEWALEHWDGGEIANPDSKGDPIVLDAAGVRKLYSRADALINRHAPARREYLAQEKAADGYLRARYPVLYDTSKPEAQAFESLANKYPQIRAITPNWRVALADMIRGQGIRMQEEAEAAKGKAPAAAKAEPIAPVAPGAPAVPRIPATQKARQKKTELSASMSEEELAAIM